MYRQLLLTVAFALSAFAFPQGKSAEPTAITIAPLSPGPTPIGPSIEVGKDGSVAAKDPILGTIAKGPKGTLVSGPLGTVAKGPAGSLVSGPLGTITDAKGPGGVSITPPKGKAL
jgi:hypothetical protein